MDTPVCFQQSLEKLESETEAELASLKWLTVAAQLRTDAAVRLSLCPSACLSVRPALCPLAVAPLLLRAFPELLFWTSSSQTDIRRPDEMKPLCP